MPPYQEIVCYDFFFVILDQFIYCSAWLRLKLNTKVGLHNFPPPDPPFSPPQTFAQLIAMEKGKTFREDTCFFILNVFLMYCLTKPNLINQTKPN